MAPFSVTVRPYSDKAKPHLKYVLRVRRPDRRVERSFFETKKKADSEATVKSQEVENLGIQALGLNHTQKIEAMTAFERLKPYGVSLLEAVAHFIQSLDRSTVTVSDLCTRYISSREQLQLSERYLGNLRGTLGRFMGACGKR